ncbi:MAG: hypothetical protein WC238_06380 [Parcubacteria group bacterium]|jgi:uncharacterized membrane protein YjdF
MNPYSTYIYTLSALKLSRKMKNIVEKEIEKHPKRSTLMIILLFTLLVAFIGALIQKNWITMLFILIISILMCIPMVIGKLSKIDIPFPLEVFSVLFIYASLFLGELNHYYTTYWWWDVLLHMASGLAFGIIGFIILYVLSQVEKIQTSPKLVAIFSFSFALAIGALWEIVEFTIDRTLGTNMQSGSFFWTNLNGGLLDTMKDLIDDSIGALFSGIMGYLYLKKNSGIVVKPMAKEFKKDNPEIFQIEKKK